LVVFNLLHQLQLNNLHNLLDSCQFNPLSNKFNNPIFHLNRTNLGSLKTKVHGVTEQDSLTSTISNQVIKVCLRSENQKHQTI
jgi:hypothetical protein